MRIVIHDYGGYPFSLQLAHALARRHEVLYLYSAGFVTPKGDMTAPAGDGCVIEPVSLGRDGARGAGLRRLIDERHYGALAGQRIEQFTPDVVMSANAPLDVQLRLEISTRRIGGRFIFWMQDVYSQAVRRLIGRRSGPAGRLAGARFARVESALARGADGVVSVSPDFIQVLRGWGVAEERIAVIPNWAPLDHVLPVQKANGWARANGLAERFSFLYTGTLGRKHNPALLVTLAASLPEASVVAVGEGAGMDWLRTVRARPSNLILLPMQPASSYNEVLGSADVGIALLEPDAATFSVPSKILTYVAAGMPVLAAIPSENLAARTIDEAQAGLTTDPGDVAAFTSAARTLLEDEAMRQRFSDNGRRYAARAFAIEPIADRFERILAGQPEPIGALATGAVGEAGG
jgi:glycosyltransferase involved in cell wall biosynthesis